jgi:hypothetical protein
MDDEILNIINQAVVETKIQKEQKERVYSSEQYISENVHDLECWVDSDTKLKIQATMDAIIKIREAVSSIKDQYSEAFDSESPNCLKSDAGLILWEINKILEELSAVLSTSNKG